ncbi:MAG: CehA/McbA family metallohydrolase [Deltaproteobacteria bacterium]|nr:CehA/McbA family metallohydrolase [Deltaproteobacteria bacterium]MBW2362573.1 CehA/McbA family metallohydrolase [Deltaproteobacteria bacterium]
MTPCWIRCNLIWLLAALGCGEPAPPQPTAAAPQPESEAAESEAPANRVPAADMSPNAQLDVVEDLRRAANLELHPSDGGGRAWVESSEPVPLQVGRPGRVTLVYEAGPDGIAADGSVTLQVSPFWRWSTPQTQIPELEGYTRVATDAAGIELHAETLGEQMLGIRIEGRALSAGERIRIEYGAGPTGAHVDDFADAASRFWFAVDGDGDGRRKLIDASPALRVVAGPAAHLWATLPSVARPGESVRLHLAALDMLGNRGTRATGSIALSDEAGLLDLPASVELAPEDGGVLVIEVRAQAAGITRVHAALGEFRATSNALQVSAGVPRILWGDVHGHSGLSDGTGVPDDYFAYARDVAGLDLVALTDHDHWGMRVLADTPELWEQIRASTRRFHAPGRFVTLLGFEWTSWLYGHRHVLYAGDTGRVIDSVDPATETPTQLWNALEGEAALTFAHHTAGEPIATAWQFAPDPRFEPLVEIVSVHGSSEAADSPSTVVGAMPGHFARDALERGYRLGFIGSGDSHDGHPGLAHLASPSGGLAAVLAEERTREAVWEALRARRTYATNGARIILRVGLGTARMGESLPAPPADEPPDLFVQLIGSAPLQHVDLIRRGHAVERVPLDERWDATLQKSVDGLASGDWLYIRAEQIDRGAAWSSPIFIE